MSSAASAYEKIIVISQETRLQGLRKRFNTESQAEFYLENQTANFAYKKQGKVLSKSEARATFGKYKAEETALRKTTESVMDDIESLGLKVQYLDRSLVPTFLFSPQDLILTLGQDGLVANCAKYVGDQPIVAINPDPSQFDGVLLPFQRHQARSAVLSVLENRARYRLVTLAEAELNDGQRLLAFNDLFIGAKSHVSSRYRIEMGKISENQSSSGILVCTGAGSTGWLSSVWNMAQGLATSLGQRLQKPTAMKWEDPRLSFVVREPFQSRQSQTTLTAGFIEPGHELIVESQMSESGVVFSDGIESDFLAFNAGAMATIKAASQKARLVIPPG